MTIQTRNLQEASDKQSFIFPFLLGLLSDPED
jgi:hypothetical protein